MFEFDAGSEGGSKGPFINWHANGRKDGTAAAKTFSLKDGDEREDVTPKFKKGVIFDIDAMQTGWAYFTPNGTDWKMNESPARFAKNPGDGWKKGVSIPVAFAGGETGTWMQAGSGTFLAVAELAKQIKSDRKDDKLPVVKMNGTFDVDFNGGGSTTCAKLEVAKWVDRPESLDASADEPVIAAAEDDDEDEF